MIGVTGGVGAGKSLVASLFVRWGGTLVSGDETGKRVVDRSKEFFKDPDRFAEAVKEVLGEDDEL